MLKVTSLVCVQESSVWDVEVNTVDRYQGRDKDCVIVSFVRSNKTGNVRPVIIITTSSTALPCFHFSLLACPSSYCNTPSFLTLQVGTLLHDWRRVNVALTRARHKLVLVGSETTLKHLPLLVSLLQLLQERAWVVELPPNTHSVSPQ